jgi:hypothetical protein
MRALRWLREVLDRFGPATGRWLRWIGIGLLLLSAVFAGNSWRLTRGLLRASAIVTENVAAFAPGGGVQYVPRLRFRLPSGQIVQALCGPGSDEIDFPAGEAVPVMYPAGHPERAAIATVWRRYAAAIVLGILGVIVLDLGLILQRLRPNITR